MSEAIKNLYKIEGGKDNARRRVEVAMDWLLSEKADGIGEQLLLDAYELHKKPITISITEHHDNTYNDLFGEYKIDITPESLRGNFLTIRLARELVNASNPNFHELVQKIVDLEYTSYDKMPKLDEPKLTKRNVKDYAENFTLKLRDEMNNILNSDPFYIRYISEVKKPAEAVAKRVAGLLGERKPLITTDKVEVKGGLLQRLAEEKDKKTRHTR